MSKDPHFLALEEMYRSAPVNQRYQPETSVEEGRAEISIEIDERDFHSAGAVHGSVYFKMLDDAAFFAANALEKTYFVLTTSFTTYITRPVSKGRMRSVGRVVNRNRSQFIAEAVVYDDDDREIGRGTGIFVRSKLELSSADGFGE